MRQSSKQLQNEFLKVYDEHFSSIYKFCVIRLRDRELAKDIAQDTFMKTWEYIKQGKKVDSLKSFLYKVARNLIIDNSRKKKSQSLDYLISEGLEPSSDTDIQFEYDEVITAQRALTLLEELPGKYQDIINLRFIEDLSITEISEIIGESSNTVSVRIHRGLSKLKKIIKNKEKEYE